MIKNQGNKKKNGQPGIKNCTVLEVTGTGMPTYFFPLFGPGKVIVARNKRLPTGNRAWGARLS